MGLIALAGSMSTLQLEFLMLIFAGWVNRSQQDVIEYLQEENRVLREQLSGQRLLGHRSMRTTARYLHLMEPERLAARACPDLALCENSAASEREQFRGLRGCRRL